MNSIKQRSDVRALALEGQNCFVMITMVGTGYFDYNNGEDNPVTVTTFFLKMR